MNKFDWFSKWNVYSPNSVAFYDYTSKKQYTYNFIDTAANNYAQILINKYKFHRGSKIAVLAENCIEYIILFSVAQKTGIILIPMNYRLAIPELKYIIDDSRPDIIYFDKKFNDKAKLLYEETNINIVDLNAVLAESTSHETTETLPIINFNEDDPLFILYTSGTTAFPKGAIYTHRMLFWNSINTELRLDLTSNDISINCAPPFHTGGWNVLLTPFIHHGATTIIMKTFEPDLILESISKHKVTIWWAVPTMLKMLMESELFEQTDFSTLRYIVVGGEALPLNVIAEWHKKGVLIRQGYGLTEVGPNVTSLDHKDAITKKGSIGTPNFYIDTKIVDDDGKEVLGEGRGELLLKGPNVTPGYWNNKEATSKSIVDGWFHTGDIVSKDSEGYLFVVDRIKNMYISGGENVYPAEVEHYIGQLKDVKEIAIIGVPDEKWGEVGKAFIVKNSGSQLSKEQVIDYCLKNLAKYKIPKHVEFIEKMPLNDAGKIDKRQLKKMS